MSVHNGNIGLVRSLETVHLKVNNDKVKIWFRRIQGVQKQQNFKIRIIQKLIKYFTYSKSINPAYNMVHINNEPIHLRTFQA